MAEIIKTYKQSMAASRFIGKKYGDKDRVNGMFGAKWGEWFDNGWFGVLEKLMGDGYENTFDDSTAYIGLMREAAGGFEYWIGCFLPAESVVPEGFEHIDFPECDLAVAWVYGKESEVYMMEGESMKRLENDGFNVDGSWCFERYACPRFTTADESGKVILDVCFFMK
jgi:predicted transcriptional regulator YdeE